MEINKYKEKIQQLELLKDLSAESYNKVLGKTRLHHVARGDILFVQGDNDKSYVYLLSGSVDLIKNNAVNHSIHFEHEEALLPLSHRQPREFTARATIDSAYISIESQTLDMLIAWENQNNYEVKEVFENPNSTDNDWLLRLLSKPVFHRSSPLDLQVLFNRFEPLKVSKGQELITQGSEADYFYIMVSGKATVTHTTSNHPNGLKLAILNSGDTFGEDALIAKQRRNSTITMISDGMIIRLSPESFSEFLNATNGTSIDFEHAQSMVKQGEAIWLDVCMPNELEGRRLPGTKNLPLILLRVKFDAEIDPNSTYILYCNDGRRSSAGAFFLRQRGVNALVLKGGINQHQKNQTESLIEESA